MYLNCWPKLLLIFPSNQEVLTQTLNGKVFNKIRMSAGTLVAISNINDVIMTQYMDN